MKHISCLLLLALLLSCTSKNDHDSEPTPPDPILGGSLVIYTPEFTSLVKVYNNNVLVRGSFPVDAQGRFVYDSILEYLHKKLPGMSFVNHALIDVSMIDNTKWNDSVHLKLEMAAYSIPDSAIPWVWPPYTIGYQAKLLGQHVSEHPGSLLWWPIQGFKPSDPLERKIGVFFTNQGYDNQPGGYNFDGLVDRLDSLLRDETYPKIIYYHCTWGKDRTGALTFGWLVKHGGFLNDTTGAHEIVNAIVVPNDNYRGMSTDYWKWLISSKKRY